MTPDQYVERIAALGFTVPLSGVRRDEADVVWYEWVGVDRTTHYRHINRPEGPPRYLRLIVELLEACPSMNPNGGGGRNG